MRKVLTKIGETIQKRRELLGLLQPQLAAIAGVSRRTIQLVENGKANPSVDTLLRIADPLGLTLQVVLKDLAKKDEV